MKRFFNRVAEPLVTAFGRNKAALDVANNFSGSVGRHMMDMVLAAMNKLHVSFNQPRLGQIFGWMRPPEPR